MSRARIDKSDELMRAYLDSQLHYVTRLDPYEGIEQDVGVRFSVIVDIVGDVIIKDH